MESTARNNPARRLRMAVLLLMAMAMPAIWADTASACAARGFERKAMTRQKAQGVVSRPICLVRGETISSPLEKSLEQRLPLSSPARSNGPASVVAGVSRIDGTVGAAFDAHRPPAPSGSPCVSTSSSLEAVFSLALPPEIVPLAEP